MKDTKFYDLGKATRPFRQRIGARVVITGVHKDSELSKHYVGMEAVLVGAHRKWRDKHTRLIWVTARLRMVKTGQTLTFGLVRFRAQEESKSTLYRKGILGNQGCSGIACLVTCLAIMTAVIPIGGFIHQRSIDARAELRKKAADVTTRLESIDQKMRLIERQINAINTELYKLDLLTPAKKTRRPECHDCSVKP